MKKFLTMLLALSVVFTYTVGTAFAADAPTYSLVDVETAVNSEVATVNGQIDTAKAYLVSQFPTTTINASEGTVDISKVSYEAVLNDLVAAEKAKVQMNANYSILAARKAAAAEAFTSFNAAEKAGYVATVSTANDYNVGGDTLSTVAVSKTGDALKGLATPVLLGEKEFNKVKAEALAKLAALDLTKYSTAIASDGGKSYYTQAKEAKEIAVAAVNSQKVTEKTETNYANAIKAVVGAVKVYDGALKEIPTMDDESKVDADLKTVKGYAVAKLQADANIAYQTKLVTLQNELIALERAEKPNATLIANKKAEIAGLKAKYDAFIQVETYKINNYTKISDIMSDNKVKLTWEFTEGNLSLAENKVKAVAKLENEAKIVALYTNAKGEPLYAAETIAAKLTEKVAAVYASGSVVLDDITLGLSESDQAEKALAARKTALKTAEVAIYVEKVKYTSVVKWVANSETFFETQLAAAKAVIEETKTAIDAAKTISEADAAFVAGYTKYDAIKTKADQADLFIPGGTLRAAYEKAQADLNAYIDYTLAQKTDAEKNALAYEVGTLKDKLGKTVKGEAYTAEDLKANYDKAVAFVNNLKTKESVDAQAKAINAKILAVNPKVTLADKGTLKAIGDEIETFKEYNTTSGYVCLVTLNETLLSSYTKSVQDLESAQVQKSYDDLIKVITVADEDAVKALRVAFDAYVAEYKAEPGTVTEKKVAQIEGKLGDAKAVAVIEMIAKLPAEITVADKGAIEAARKAYNELASEKQEKVANLALLVKAEAALTVAEEVAFKTTVSKNKSTVGKGYIKLAWTAVPGADGYQVFKSTKKYSGFGTKAYFSTTKTTYKNTKGLVKGKRYYYKVRAYKVVDGKKVYGQWSTKAWRKAK